jgi:hypothetical protein
MTSPNVCWIIACKDSTGEYIPDDAVYVDFEEAIQMAIAALDEDPTQDPRVVQVILDPCHPSLYMRRVGAEVEAAMTQADAGKRQGLELALSILMREAEVQTVDEAEQGGKQ